MSLLTALHLQSKYHGGVTIYLSELQILLNDEIFELLT